MNPVLSDRLRSLYPDLTGANRDQSTDQRNSLLEFECGSGWFKVLVETLGVLDDLRRTLNCEIQLGEVKQKFARLRLSWGTTAPDLGTKDRQLLEEICAHFSTQTCEFCGQAGQVQCLDGVYLTTCSDHSVDWDIVEENLSEDSSIIENLMSYERQGFDTREKVYVFTDKTGLPGEMLRYREFTFPERFGPTAMTSLFEPLRVANEEIIPCREAYNRFISMREAGRLINFYWPTGLEAVDQEISSRA